MATYYTKTGDTSADLRVILEDRAGAFDLTGYTVAFRMRKRGESAVVVNGTCTVDADQETNTGYVTYEWEDEGVETAGEYQAEFVATAPDGKEITFPRKMEQSAFLKVFIVGGVE